MNKKLGFGLLIFIIFIVGLLGFTSAYVNSFMSNQIADETLFSNYMQNSLRFDKTKCQGSTDFILQIAPFGCEPAVVRSDLLEENDVPVFCQIAATKINPLVDVEAIKTMSITGKHTGGVKVIKYHPSQAALGLVEDGNLENPVLENLGYVVIILKGNPNESAMPDYVEGNLTARIRYDVERAFGVGRAEYYLPVMSDNDFEDYYKGYGFWNGRGYLRAEYVRGDEAKISIYSDAEVASSFGGSDGRDYSRLKFSSYTIKKGEPSPEIFLPGFDPCMASLKLRLNSVENPDTRARIIVNSEIMEVAQGERFLNNKCEVHNIDKKGFYESVEIGCATDDGKNSRFTLSKSPGVKITLDENNEGEDNEITENYQVGDWLYEYQIEKNNPDNAWKNVKNIVKDEENKVKLELEKRNTYLGYVGSISNSENLEDMFIVLVSKPAKDGGMSESDLEFASNYVKYANLESKTRSDIVEGTMEGLSSAGAAIARAGNYVFSGTYYQILPYDGTLPYDKKFIHRFIETDEGIRNYRVAFEGFSDEFLSSLSISGSDNYAKAMEDFNLVSSVYTDEREIEDIETYGEKSLYEAIRLAYKTHNKIDIRELCNRFNAEYPDSTVIYDVARICEDEYFLHSSSNIPREVSIDGEVKLIAFERALEPSFEDYGIELIVKGPKGEYTYKLSKDGKISLSPIRYGEKNYDEESDEESKEELPLEGEEWFELESLDDNDARINVRVADSISQRSFDIDTIRLVPNVPKNVGPFEFTLKEINLRKVARVTVEPNFNNQLQNSTFPFKVGIEKRAIQLSPEKINDKIENLDEDIENIGKIVDFLGTTVEWGNKVCLATEGVLTVKTFLKNLNGGSIARNMVMNNAGGWNDKCQTLVIEQPEAYKSLDACFLKHTNEIDGKVAEYEKIIEEQNQFLNKVKDESKEPSQGGALLEQGIVNKEYVADKYLERFKYEELEQVLKSSLYYDDETDKVYPRLKADGTPGGEGILLSEIEKSFKLEHFNEGSLSIENIRDVELYQRILSIPITDEKDYDESAYKELYGLLFDINANTERSKELTEFAGSVGTNVKRSDIDYVVVSESNAFGKQKISDYTYKGLTVNNLGKALEKHPGDVEKGESEFFPGSTPISILKTNLDEQYILVLSDSGDGKNLPVLRYNDKKISEEEKEEEKEKTDNQGSSERKIYIYETNGVLVDSSRSIYRKLENQFGDLTFIRYDKASYQNTYLNPEVKYFEEPPYEGYPSVVPLDRAKGWYAATKPILPVGSNIASFDKSGRVVSFWLCNVGENGLENYISGDDIYQMINHGTGQDLDMFYGLDAETTKGLINDALRAIEAAQNAYKKGARSVNIGGQTYYVGNPTTSVPAVQCQDFMSPKDCNILFNVCDPFICPSSRCDLGGSYPVRDVIQSGIIGSIALCYPNAKWQGGDVYVPVCVSGVHAGLDGWLQVKKAYRSCLQENLDTGETVGICDEMQSIYMCDFFWRQALPIAQLVVPKLLSKALGQSARGGGEYMSVKDAWRSAGDSLDYFKQYYANHVFTAFKMRSVDEVGAEVCKSFPSVLFPDGASLIDSLSQPYSPVQFHGKFSEIPLTTATNPPLSHYKVTFMIYAGQDRGAYYRVYLRGASGSSFYQDASFNRIVKTGYISAGETISESIDEQWPSGYKELCISVNGQEECGFKEVSTSFAVDYMNDLYLQQQAEQTDIRSENECISGSASLFSLIDTNVQSAAEELIDPAIYNKGIIRICATEDPGVGTDDKAGQKGSRWVEVGYCGDKKIKCWQDQESVADVIESYKIEEETLYEASKKTLEKMQDASGFFTGEDLKKELEKIAGFVDKMEQITGLTNLLDKVMYGNDKANIFLQRGKIYASLVEVCPTFCNDAGTALHKGIFNYDSGECEVGDEVYNDCENLGCEPEGQEQEHCKVPEKVDCKVCLPEEIGSNGKKGVLYSGIRDSETGKCEYDERTKSEDCEFGCENVEEGKGECLGDPSEPFDTILDDPGFVSPRLSLKYAAFSRNELCLVFDDGVWKYRFDCKNFLQDRKNFEDWVTVSSKAQTLEDKSENIVRILARSEGYLDGLNKLLYEVDVEGSKITGWWKNNVLNQDFKLVSLENRVVASHGFESNTITFYDERLGNYDENKKEKDDGIYFKYNNGWEWSFNEAPYRPVSERAIDSKKDAIPLSRGVELTRTEEDILDSLERLNLEQGATVLFGILTPQEAVDEPILCSDLGGECMQESECLIGHIIDRKTSCEEDSLFCCSKRITYEGSETLRYMIKFKESTSERDIFYNYDKLKGWKWTWNKKQSLDLEWFYLNDLEDQAKNVPGGLYEEDKSILESLDGKSYLEGVQIFIDKSKDKTISEGIWSGSSVTYAESDEQNIFRVHAFGSSPILDTGGEWRLTTGLERINFRFLEKDGKWEWAYSGALRHNPNKFNWVEVSDDETISDYQSKNKIDYSIIKLIKSLVGKDFDIGAQIILDPSKHNYVEKEIIEEEEKVIDGSDVWYHLNFEGSVGDGINYKYSSGEWYWTKEERRRDSSVATSYWSSVNNFVAQENEERVRKDDVDFIESLQGKSYLDGFKLLFEKAIEEGIGKSLKSEKVEFSFEDLYFDTKYHKEKNIRFSYVGDSWYWTYKGEDVSRVDVDEFIEKYESVNGVMNEIDKRVIFSLRTNKPPVNKNLYEGALMIFHPLQTPDIPEEEEEEEEEGPKKIIELSSPWYGLAFEDYGVYYKYGGGEWYWAWEKSAKNEKLSSSNWHKINDFEEDEFKHVEELTEANIEFFDRLKGEFYFTGYFTGVTYLRQRATDEILGKGMMSENAVVSSSGVFTLEKSKGLKNMRLYFTNDKWYFGYKLLSNMPDKVPWIDVSDEDALDELYKDGKMFNTEKDLVISLRGVGLTLGSYYIFNGAGMPTNYPFGDEDGQVYREPEVKYETGDCSVILQKIPDSILCKVDDSSCRLTPEAVKLLIKASESAEEKKYVLRINSAYRTYAQQEALWNKNPNPSEVARPSKYCTAPHQTGNAVDVTIFDDSGNKVKDQAREDIMTDAGWVRYVNEAWHYECCGTKRFNDAKEDGVDVI
jgi:hypothetical protein